MRVDLARAICEKKDIICFDEFTSVVDREVAQLGSYALQKAIRRQNKKFIAVTCHYDIIDWLEPDWIFNTDTMEYKYTRGLLQRPKIRLEIYETKGFWQVFGRYHYLTHTLNNSAKQYIGFINDKPVAFIAYRHIPHPKGAMQMVHRLVVLPDYQGLGIGSKILNLTASKIDLKFPRVHIVTSLRLFGKSLMRNKSWRLIRAGRTGPNKNIATLNKAISANRNTYSFCYIGKRTRK